MTAKKTIKKSLSRSKSKKTYSNCKKVTPTKPVKKKYAVLKFDLENEYEWQSFKNAMKADYMATKIDNLYQDVFRSHLKYDQPLVEAYTGVEIKIDEMTADILRAIFHKCNEHFYPSEE